LPIVSTPLSEVPIHSSWEHFGNLNIQFWCSEVNTSRPLIILHIPLLELDMKTIVPNTSMLPWKDVTAPISNVNASIETSLHCPQWSYWILSFSPSSTSYGSTPQTAPSNFDRTGQTVFHYNATSVQFQCRLLLSYSKKDPHKWLLTRKQETHFLHSVHTFATSAIHHNLYNLMSMVHLVLGWWWLSGRPGIHLQSRTQQVHIWLLEKDGLVSSCQDAHDLWQASSKLSRLSPLEFQLLKMFQD
jgi:hypothetical protein